MPEIDINYTAKNRSDGSIKYLKMYRQDACFRMLGKNQDYALNLRNRLEMEVMGYDLEGIQSIDLLDTKWVQEEQLTPLRERFSFLRCVQPKEKRSLMQFNVQKYSLNEVMHALFWMRAMFTEQQLLTRYSKTLERTGNPSLALFMSCMSEHFRIAYEHGEFVHQGMLEPDSDVVHGDGTVLRLKDLTPIRLCEIVTGRYSRRFLGGNLYSRLKDLTPYTKNMSKYGQPKGNLGVSGKPKKCEPSALDLTRALAIKCAKKAGLQPPVVQYTRLGLRVGPLQSHFSQNELRPAMRAHAVNLLPEVLAEFNVPPEIINDLLPIKGE